jgi:hypothetical protein
MTLRNSPGPCENRFMAAEQQLELNDGRRLQLTVSGPTGVMPFVFHHGTPGAGTPIRALERAVHDRGLRYVSFSRPGYGESSRLSGRRVVGSSMWCWIRPPCSPRWRRTAASSLAGPVANPSRWPAGPVWARPQPPWPSPGLRPPTSPDWIGLDGRYGRRQRRRVRGRAGRTGHAASISGGGAGDAQGHRRGRHRRLTRPLLPDVDKAVLTEEFGRTRRRASQKDSGTASTAGSTMILPSPNPGDSSLTNSRARS